MKVKYDPEADAMYIKLRNNRFDHNIKVDKNTILNCDKEGNIIGIEILFVKERNPKLLKELKEELISA